MARLVEAEVPAARQPDRGQPAPALLDYVAEHVRAAAAQLRDRRVELVAHEVELVAVLVGRMARDFARREREDQPATARVDVLESEHFAKERAVGLGVARVDDRVGAGDHAGTVWAIPRRSPRPYTR